MKKVKYQFGGKEFRLKKKDAIALLAVRENYLYLKALDNDKLTARLEDRDLVRSYQSGHKLTARGAGVVWTVALKEAPQLFDVEAE